MMNSLILLLGLILCVRTCNGAENEVRRRIKAAAEERELSDRVPSTLIELFPFDISIALTNNIGIDGIVLRDAVSQWLNANFDKSVQRLDGRHNFDQVILKEYTGNARRNTRNRELQSTHTVTYEGMTVWKRDKPLPDETIVAAIELEALLDRDGLVDALQQEDDSTGLGSYVVDAKGDINRHIGGGTGRAVDGAGSTDGSGSAGESSLDIIIIIAIVIAVLAFFLLAFALLMAWRHNKQRNNRGGSSNNYDNSTTSKKKSPKASNEATGSRQTKTTRDVEDVSPPPSEIAPSLGGGIYPESVISEDISTSLSAYYKGKQMEKEKPKPATLNDAGSISSMESYGYSLDGYASSIAQESRFGKKSTS